MHKLKTYLADKPKAKFAVKVGIRPAYLSQIMSGFRSPSFDLMQRIEKETNGEVDLNSWTAAAIEKGAAA